MTLPFIRGMKADRMDADGASPGEVVGHGVVLELLGGREGGAYVSQDATARVLGLIEA